MTAKTDISPPDPTRLNDPSDWHDKAEEARSKAEEISERKQPSAEPSSRDRTVYIVFGVLLAAAVAWVIYANYWGD